MHHRSRSGDRLRHLGAAKSVERPNFEMFAQSEDCLFRQKRVTVVFKRVIDFADLLLLSELINNSAGETRASWSSNDCRSSIWVIRNSPVLRSA